MIVDCVAGFIEDLTETAVGIFAACAPITAQSDTQTSFQNRLPVKATCVGPTSVSGWSKIS
jgi:hypothetical protein